LDTTDAADPSNCVDANAQWNQLKAILTETAERTLSKQVRTVKKEWIKLETFALIEEKRNCLRNGPKYRELKRQVRAKLRQDRADHLKGICEEIKETGKKTSQKTCFKKLID